VAEIGIPALSGELRAYLAVPGESAPGLWPGVVVLHEAFGVNDDIRAHADRLAGHGYLALAPDLFSWASKPRCLVSTFRDLLRGRGRAHDDIDAARRWLADQANCTGRVGVVGFCMGGGFALLAAPRGGFDAAAVNYGLVPREAERALAGACPVVASYGGRDRFLRGHATRLERILEVNGADHDVVEYPEASHSFLNRHTGWVAATDRVTGLGYRHQEAEDAWRRILAFFHRHLVEVDRD
jgi:carboxymethylenebutenolidase